MVILKSFLNHCLRDAQNMCALTKVSTVLKPPVFVTAYKLVLAVHPLCSFWDMRPLLWLALSSDT